MSRTAIVISDTHLGTARSDPLGLREFLLTLRPEASRLRLILNGDIVDLWRATDEECAVAAAPVFEVVRELVDRGALVDWVIGNHDHHLLRSLDGDGSPVLDVLPRGVRFHHPFRRLVQNGRVFVITHGDVYDFLHIPLQGMGPLSWVLGPHDVYGFYDWVYGLEKGLVAAFDRTGTRGLLLAWVAEQWRELSEALGRRATDDLDFARTTAASRFATAAAMSDAMSYDADELARDLTRIELSDVWRRTDDVLRWRRMRYVSPHPTRTSRRRYAGRHEIVTGHFHDARREDHGSWAVTDDGDWWRGPGQGGTFVRIEDGLVHPGTFTPGR